MGARTGGRRIGQQSNHAQPDGAAVFRGSRRAIERHLTQNPRLRKRGNPNAAMPIPCRLHATTVPLHAPAARISAPAAPAPAVKTSLRSADRYFSTQRPSRSHAASAKASSSRLALRFTKLTATAAMRRPPCLRHRNIRARSHPRRADRTRLVIALIFGARILKSDTRLADIPSGLMRRGFTAFAS
ncbi:hypothetical protein B0G57_101236 [Trinickia symbiotica]|nr:hypothetical protein B0G57_101236 [Trinickia symbiotica]